MTVVLGVDSGSLSTGYGVVESRGQMSRSLAYGAIRCAPGLPHPERLAAIASELREIMRRYAPDALAIEKVFVARNAASALKLGQVRGAVMLTAVEAGLRVLEYAPTEVKSAVTGYGRAEKSQVQLMTKTILGLREVPRPHDAADALALALCALSSETWRSRVAP